jgi:hypothetical protein
MRNLKHFLFAKTKLHCNNKIKNVPVTILKAKFNVDGLKNVDVYKYKG